MRTCAAILLMLVVLGACTGQTGEEEPAAECRHEPMAISVSDPTPIKIVPAAYFTRLQGASRVYSPKWGHDGHAGEAVELTFSELSDEASFVASHAEGDTSEAGCPDFVTLDMTIGLDSIESGTFAEKLQATARVFEDESGSIAAMLPREDLSGEFGAGGLSPAGLPFDRLVIQLALTDGAISWLLISAETDAGDKKSELVATWP